MEGQSITPETTGQETAELDTEKPIKPPTEKLPNELNPDQSLSGQSTQQETTQEPEPNQQQEMSPAVFAAFNTPTQPVTEKQTQPLPDKEPQGYTDDQLDLLVDENPRAYREYIIQEGARKGKKEALKELGDPREIIREENALNMVNNEIAAGNPSYLNSNSQYRANVDAVFDSMKKSGSDAQLKLAAAALVDKLTGPRAQNNAVQAAKIQGATEERQRATTAKTASIAAGSITQPQTQETEVPQYYTKYCGAGGFSVDPKKMAEREKQIPAHAFGQKSIH
jgi:hypothetical protein